MSDKIYLIEEDFFVPLSRESDRKKKKFTCKNIICFIGFLFAIVVLLDLIGGFTKFSNNNNTSINVFEENFNLFVLMHNKTYKNREQYSERLKIFIKNYDQAKQWNMSTTSPFLDWTDDEIQQILMPLELYNNTLESFSNTNLSEQLNFKSLLLPKSIDWRTKGCVTSVKNQGQCGSCWAFATVGATESYNAINRGKLVSLSEQQMVDCIHDGCHGVNLDPALNYIRANGLAEDKIYPYKGVEQQCRNATIPKLQKIGILNYFLIRRDENSIANWMGSKGPVSFTMFITRKFTNVRTEIYTPSNDECQRERLRLHAMIIVGYDEQNGKPYWIVKNSWGPSWGDKGYFKLARGLNAAWPTRHLLFCKMFLNKLILITFINGWDEDLRTEFSLIFL